MTSQVMTSLLQKAMRVFLAIFNLHHEVYKLPKDSELPFWPSEYSAHVGESINLSKDKPHLKPHPLPDA